MLKRYEMPQLQSSCQLEDPISWEQWTEKLSLMAILATSQMKRNMASELKIQLSPLEKANFSAKFLKISDTNSYPGTKIQEQIKKLPYKKAL